MKSLLSICLIVLLTTIWPEAGDVVARSGERRIPKRAKAVGVHDTSPSISTVLRQPLTPIELHPPIRPSKQARLLFTGDVMQHFSQIISARQKDGTFDYSSVFTFVKPLFEQADLAIVNLETTLTTTSDYSGYPRFRSPLALAEALRNAGVGVCVLANNHCCDGGAEGIRTTLAELDRCGIARTGVFADSADYRANHPLKLVANEIRIALFNYTYGTNGLAVPSGMIVNLIDTAAMSRDLHSVQKSEFDCIVVFIHWGEEYEREANAAQREVMKFLRRHNVDVIIGSHPHVVQPFETDKSGVVFYSLGNFVSNQSDRYCDGGIMANVRLVQPPGKQMCYDAEAIPVWVQRPGYRIVTPEAADTLKFTDSDREKYLRFISDTHMTLYQ